MTEEKDSLDDSVSHLSDEKPSNELPKVSPGLIIGLSTALLNFLAGLFTFLGKRRNNNG
jgi:hypothetical protein